MQGGIVSVKSEENKGSEFCIDLNFKIGLANGSEPEKICEEILPGNYSHVSVLIVEDNKVNQLLIKNMLKKFGFEQLDTAINGSMALELLYANHYDLILMDIQMPGMDGYDITKEIRHRLKNKLENVPVIAISADASEKEKTKAQESGMNDYVVKPYTSEELFSVILKYIQPLEEASKEQPKRSLTKPNEPGINLKFLDKFTGGDEDLAIQLVEIFLKQAPESVQKIEAGLSTNNWKEIHAVAHKVKSSIAIFELNELKKIITNIEEYSRDMENLEKVPRLFSEFREGIKLVMRDLDAELRKMKLQQNTGKN